MKSDKIFVVANGKREEVTLPCNVAQFVTARGWKPTQVVVERNGQVLERGDLDHIVLQSGDQLEVIVPVAGG